MEYRPGDLYDVPPGHDGWTIGEEDCVMLEWSGIGGDVTVWFGELDEPHTEGQLRRTAAEAEKGWLYPSDAR
jgi:hypothetical protein